MNTNCMNEKVMNIHKVGIMNVNEIDIMNIHDIETIDTSMAQYSQIVNVALATAINL